MVRVELSRAARSDLHGVYVYSLEAFGHGVAAKYLSDIEQALTRLADYPKMGAPGVHLKRGTRCLPCRQHHIFYRYERGTVRVARVLHKAMDPNRWLA